MPSRALLPPPAAPLPAVVQHSHSPLPKPKLLLLSLTISLSCVLLLALLLFLLYLYFSLIHRSSPTLPFDSTATPTSTTAPQARRFSYRELRSATNNFDPANALGRGASGSVFRGVLRDGKSVAVKRLEPSASACPTSSHYQQQELEFQNELRLLAGIPKGSPFIVSLLGYCVDKRRRRRLLVYEYLSNGSLQEALFGTSGAGDATSDFEGLEWERRYQIITDVAQAIAFLHTECDPPVIHGDIKPSNVLLGADFRAKISDFGLARVKTDEGAGGTIDFSQDLLGYRSQELVWKSQDLVAAAAIDSSPPVDFALALMPSCSSPPSRKSPCQGVTGLDDVSGNGLASPKGKGAAAMTPDSCEDELFSIDHSKDLSSGIPDSPSIDEAAVAAAAAANNGTHPSGNNNECWWWRQDRSGEFCGRDYVSEWIGSQIGPVRNPEWRGDNDGSARCSPRKLSGFAHSAPLEKCHHVECADAHEVGNGKEGTHKWRWIKWKQGNREEDVDEEAAKSVGVCDDKNKRKMREWWKEEYFAELSKKGKYCSHGFPWFRAASGGTGAGKHVGADLQEPTITPPTHGINDPCGDPTIAVDDISFCNGWRKRRRRKRRNNNSSSICSGDIYPGGGDPFSRELSNTTSMRGTVCYVAPESCGGLAPRTDEKADLYSFGVLVLVVVSGRRPLHVLASPMKLERANLVSWCRHLAQGGGDVLELVDERLRGTFDKEQAVRCVHLALLCLQRNPDLRPQSVEVVRVLKGEMELPPLPVEFSPSPPPGTRRGGRSRRKASKSDTG